MSTSRLLLIIVQYICTTTRCSYIFVLHQFFSFSIMVKTALASHCHPWFTSGEFTLLSKFFTCNGWQCIYLQSLSIMTTVATDNRGLICGFPRPGSGVRVTVNVSSPSTMTSLVMVMSMMSCLLLMADPTVNVTRLFTILM